MVTLLILTVGLTSVPQYSTMDSMLANTLLIQGNQMNKKLIENMLQSQPNVLYAIKAQAIKEELLDKKEVWYFVKTSEFALDVKVISQRFHCLENAPKLSDKQYLLTKEQCEAGMEFNRQYQKTLESRALMETDRREAFQEYMAYNRQHYELYDAMRDAQCDYNMITCRRKAMAKVIRLIGEEDFYNRKFPPCVPLWQFVEE